jgi:hypothetical protein
MKVFLDIDGVMVHGNPHKQVEIAEDGFYVFLDRAVNIFNTIQAEEIILSTSHKNRFPISQWIELLRNRGLQFVNLSRIESDSLYVSRKQEIEDWIVKNNYNFNDIIILDDDKTLNSLPPALKERLVLTSSYKGLCIDDVSSIQAILLTSKHSLKNENIYVKEPNSDYKKS